MQCELWSIKMDRKLTIGFWNFSWCPEIHCRYAGDPRIPTSPTSNTWVRATIAMQYLVKIKKCILHFEFAGRLGGSSSDKQLHTKHSQQSHLWCILPIHSWISAFRCVCWSVLVHSRGISCPIFIITWELLRAPSDLPSPTFRSIWCIDSNYSNYNSIALEP